MKNIIYYLQVLFLNIKRYFRNGFKSPDKDARNIKPQIKTIKEFDYRINFETWSWNLIKHTKVRKGHGTIPLSVDVFGKRLTRHVPTRHLNKKRHGKSLRRKHSRS